MVRLTPSAPAGHSSALAVAVPSKEASRKYAATVRRMAPFYLEFGPILKGRLDRIVSLALTLPKHYGEAI